MTSTVITSSVGPVSAVETVAVAATGLTVAGSTAYKVTLVGTVSSDIECNPTFNLRMGTTGTVADALVASVHPVVSDFNVNEPFTVEFISTFQSTTLVDAAVNVQGNGNGGIVGITQVNPSAVTLGGAPTAITATVAGSVQIVDNAAMTMGSANIALTGTGSSAGAVANVGNVSIGNPVAFAATVGNLVAGTVYYIVASNVGTAGGTTAGYTNTIQVSASVGGAPIVASATGATTVSLANKCLVTVNQAIVQLM